MRISDWSSDVCSSDLPLPADSRVLRPSGARGHGHGWPPAHKPLCLSRNDINPVSKASRLKLLDLRVFQLDRRRPTETRPGDLEPPLLLVNLLAQRSQKRRVGNTDVSTVKSRWF